MHAGSAAEVGAAASARPPGGPLPAAGEPLATEAQRWQAALLQDFLAAQAEANPVRTRNEAKLAMWVAGKLDRYDTDAAFAARRDVRHGSRAGYEQYLSERALGELQAPPPGAPLVEPIPGRLNSDQIRLVDSFNQLWRDTAFSDSANFVDDDLGVAAGPGSQMDEHMKCELDKLGCYGYFQRLGPNNSRMNAQAVIDNVHSNVQASSNHTTTCSPAADLGSRCVASRVAKKGGGSRRRKKKKERLASSSGCQ